MHARLTALIMGMLATLAVQAQAQERNPVVQAVLGAACLELELAHTPAARYRGLSRRPGLATGRGMGFAYPYPGRWGMIMRDMLFALDFVWVRAGVVEGVTSQVPPPRPGELPVEMRPPVDVDMVLELPAGWAIAHGVGNGARLVLSPRP